ncbi:Uncharacterised protein [Chlamydia trachomatis]|nr:Uncharacterised protein [Chlamydia trachomatis]
MLPKLLKALVLRGEAAFAGGIDHQNGLAGKIGQGLLFTLYGGARDAQQGVAHGNASVRKKEPYFRSELAREKLSGAAFIQKNPRYR